MQSSTPRAAVGLAEGVVNDLHVSLTTAGLFYLTNVTAPFAGYLIGARSDRSGKRLGLFRWCALAGFLGWVAMALASQAWMPFVISAVVLAFAGAAGSQLFAAVHDDLKTTASPVADGVVSIVRMALTAGWVVGPVLGSILATAAGCFALTGDAAGMFAGQILMGGVWGVFAALGIIVAQRLLRQAVATASAVFMSSTAIASALGGLTGSLGVSALGLPHVFLAPAAYGLIATSGFAVMSRTRHAVH